MTRATRIPWTSREDDLVDHQIALVFDLPWYSHERAQRHLERVLPRRTRPAIQQRWRIRLERLKAERVVPV